VVVLGAAVVSLPRLIKLPRDFVRDNDVMFWVLVIAVTAFVFARLPHEAAYLIPLYPFGFFLMARYFRKWAFVCAAGAIVLAGFFDFTAPGEEISMGELVELRPGEGMIFSNADTMRAQISFVEDLEQYDVEANSVVSVGFVYPLLAVRNYDEEGFTVGILDEDRDAISQLTDGGKIEQATGPDQPVITWVWLLEFEQFEEFRRNGKSFAYTQDAGRSQAGLYEYRVGLYGAEEIDLGRSPTGGSGAARTDR
jgi:hypothetical protein